MAALAGLALGAAGSVADGWLSTIVAGAGVADWVFCTVVDAGGRNSGPFCPQPVKVNNPPITRQGKLPETR